MDVLKRHFNINPESSFLDGKFVRYLTKDTIYTLVPVTNVPEDLLIEMYEMSEHLMNQGDRYVSTFYPSTENKFLVTHNEEDFVVLKNSYNKYPKKQNIGRKLAKFHVRGRSINTTIEKTSRIGQWKSFWEKRLEQMERAWYQSVQEHLDQDFDRLFIDSFPYYMGLSENAIQYLNDTELDDTPMQVDAGTICHERFNQQTWGQKVLIHSPFDWVFDHSSRDIAEWIRDRYVQNKKTFKTDLQQFLQSYQSVSPLSTFGWRCLYARLLFPLHYFECIEEYFLTNSEKHQKYLEEKLRRILRDSKEYENFLGEFYQLAEIPVDRVNIPEVQWLKG